MGEAFTGMRSQSGIAARLVLIFFGMNVIGTVYTNLFMLQDNRILSEFAVHEKNMGLLLEMDWKLLFAHIFKLRCIQAAVFLLGSHVFGLQWALYILTALLGTMFGMLVTVETAGLGAAGMAYGIASWMPQGIFYGIIFYFMAIQAGQAKGSLPERNTVFFHGGYRGKEQGWRLALLVKLMLIAALIAIGSIAEAYLNPRLILFCNQHLVPVIKL